jgi:hypothetical protein
MESAGNWDIANNTTLYAKWTVNTHTLTAFAGVGGTISPSGVTTVNCGDNMTFTITPDNNYEIERVLVNNSDVGAVGSYTFSNVTANGTIEVVFKQILSADATLSDISVSSGTLTPAFSPENTTYTVEVSNAVTSITVIGTANHENATVSGTVIDKMLNVGSNVVELTVSAEDGTINIYTITVIRDSESALTGLYLNGVTVPVASDMEYSSDCDETWVTLRMEVSQGATVSPSSGEMIPLMMLTGNDVLGVGITVTSLLGRTSHEYYLRIYAPFTSDKLYYSRWSDVVTVNANPWNNDNIDIYGTRWYRRGSSEVVSTADYLDLSKLSGSASDYYAEVQTSSNSVWRKVCGSIQTRSAVKVVAYPNPVKRGESLTLRLPATFVGGKMNIYTLTGSTVKTNIPLSSENLSADVSQYGTGVYLLSITAKTGEQEVVKVVVE